ncbi:hypothetical protein MJO28_003843, partial [Puccinia striiformis f. sp. tritici]
ATLPRFLEQHLTIKRHTPARSTMATQEELRGLLMKKSPMSKIVFHLADILDHPSFKKQHQPVLDNLLQHYLKDFKATYGEADIDVLLSKSVGCSTPLVKRSPIPTPDSNSNNNRPTSPEGLFTHANSIKGSTRAVPSDPPSSPLSPAPSLSTVEEESLIEDKIVKAPRQWGSPWDDIFTSSPLRTNNTTPTTPKQLKSLSERTWGSGRGGRQGSGSLEQLSDHSVNHPQVNCESLPRKCKRSQNLTHNENSNNSDPNTAQAGCSDQQFSRKSDPSNISKTDTTRLTYWELLKNTPVNPVKNQRCIANAAIIICGLPNLFGRRIPEQATIESPMFTDLKTCFLRCEKSVYFHFQNKLLVFNDSCIDISPGKIILSSKDDPLIGNLHVNHAVLDALLSGLESTKHLLYSFFKHTLKPNRGGWKTFSETLGDIKMILSPNRVAVSLSFLNTVDPFSDTALIEVHSTFQDLAECITQPDPLPTSKNSKHLKSFGQNGGLQLVYEYILSALCALIALRLGEHRKIPQPSIRTKDLSKNKPHAQTKGFASLAHLLIAGVGAVFSQPTDRTTTPQWKSSMLLEYGAILVEQHSTGIHEDCKPFWNDMGNTRLHIIQTLGRMGFGQNQPINWKTLLEVFISEFSAL